MTDGRTDGPTDGQTDGQTDKAGCRVAKHVTENLCLKAAWFIDNNFTVEMEITLSTALEEAREIEGIENDDNGDNDLRAF